MKGLINHVDYICYSLGELASGIQETDENLAEELWVAAGCVDEFMEKLDGSEQLSDKVREWIENKEDWYQAAINWFEQEDNKKTNVKHRGER